MTYRHNIFASLAVAFIAAGVMSAQQKEKKCKNATIVLECLKEFMANGHELDSTDARLLKRSAEVADYNYSDSCGDVATLIANTRAAAPKYLGIANDTKQLVPWYFYEGKPMYLDTVSLNPDTIEVVAGSYARLTGKKGNPIHLIMTEDSLSYESMFSTIMHEIGHAVNPGAKEPDIAKMESCIKRRPDKEKKKPNPGWGGGGWVLEVTVNTIHGYCEYELRVYCDKDEDGNSRDPCRVVLVKVYCTELA